MEKKIKKKTSPAWYWRAHSFAFASPSLQTARLQDQIKMTFKSTGLTNTAEE